DLPVEERRAGRLFVRGRLAVVRRAALEHVRDPDLVARDAHALRDDVGEQLARAADERHARAVLVRARGFADEEHAARAFAVLEDGLRPRAAETALRALRDRGAEFLERVARGRDRAHAF